MGGVAFASLVGVVGRRLLLLLLGLRDGSQPGPALLSQLGCAGEGIWHYRRRGASIPCPPRMAIVHLGALRLRRSLLLLLVWLAWRVLVGIGRRIWHGNGSGLLKDRREYLCHRYPSQQRRVWERDRDGEDGRRRCRGAATGVERQRDLGAATPLATIRRVYARRGREMTIGRPWQGMDRREPGSEGEGEGGGSSSSTRKQNMSREGAGRAWRPWATDERERESSTWCYGGQKTGGKY